jgi:hypothetical protein
MFEEVDLSLFCRPWIFGGDSLTVGFDFPL